MRPVGYYLNYFLLLLVMLGSSACSVPIKTEVMDGQFPGIKRITSSENLAQIMIVHGMGDHKVGYSSHIRSGLIQTLGLQKDGDPVLFKIQAEGDVSGYAYLKIWQYRYSGEKIVRMYELTWSPITREIKEITFADDVELNIYRQNLNSTIKQFVNSYLSDPIMYTGKYGKPIRSVFEKAICNIMLDTGEKRIRKISACTRKEDAGRVQIPGGVAIISHSLGSKIVYDTLYQIAKNSDKYWLAQEFIGRIRSVYMMANQISFLELASASSKKLLEQNRKNSMQEFIRVRAGLVRDKSMADVYIVAFTDPDDMLSYPLPQAYCKSESGDVQIHCVNVFINNNLKSLFGQISNPVTAHTGYKRNTRVIAMISCGSNHKAEKECYRNALKAKISDD